MLLFPISLIGIFVWFLWFVQAPIEYWWDQERFPVSLNYGTRNTFFIYYMLFSSSSRMYIMSGNNNLRSWENSARNTPIGTTYILRKNNGDRIIIIRSRQLSTALCNRPISGRICPHYWFVRVTVISYLHFCIRGKEFCSFRGSSFFNGCDQSVVENMSEETSSGKFEELLWISAWFFSWK